MSEIENGLSKNKANYAALSPLSFLERTRKTFPNQIAIEYKDYKLTYQQVGERCDALAGLVKSKNYANGSTIAVMIPNIPVMWECHFGVPMATGVLNAINTRLDSITVRFILEHGESKIFIYDSEYSKIVEKALENLNNPPLLIEYVDKIHGAQRSTFADKFNCLDYETELEKFTGFKFDHVLPTDEWNSIALNYTSGTTGNPKGVVYHHRGAYLNAIGNTLTWDLPMHPKYLWTLPMFHCNGWCFPWTIAMRAGTNICLRKVTGQNIYEKISSHGVEYLCGAPTVLSFIINTDTNHVKKLLNKVKLMTAAAPPPAKILEQIEKCGFDVTHVYGLTEVYGPAVICKWKDEWNNLSATEKSNLKSRQGVSYLVQEDLKVVNSETRKEVKHNGNELGEVLLRGNITMKGYLKDEDATRKAFQNGWFKTGDLGVIYKDGYIQLKDRAKDIIISGGENISSIEIENCIFKIEGVVACAVIAKPDEKWGETPCAFIEAKEGASITKEKVIKFCKENLANFKVPREVIFRELPKTSTGKIQKVELRKFFL